jgi:S1-C subfamily serine protease
MARGASEDPAGDRVRVEGRPSSGISLQVRPHLDPETGVFDGVAVEALEPPELAQQVDIRPGDVLRTVNGQRLLTPTQSVQVLKKAWQQSELSIELLRKQELLTKIFKRRVAS